MRTIINKGCVGPMKSGKVTHQTSIKKESRIHFSQINLHKVISSSV